MGFVFLSLTHSSALAGTSSNLEEEKQRILIDKLDSFTIYTAVFLLSMF